MINKPLIHFQKKSSFENALNNGEITDKSLCFIKDVQEIYTHGQLYACHFGANLNVDKIEGVESAINNKVDIEQGKALVPREEISKLAKLNLPIQN